MRPLIASVAVTLVLVTATLPVVAADDAVGRARALLARVPLIDGHNDLPWTLREVFAGDLTRADLRRRGATVDTDIPRLREGLVSGQFWSVYILAAGRPPSTATIDVLDGKSR